MGLLKSFSFSRAVTFFAILFLITALPHQARGEVTVTPKTIRVGLVQDAQSQEFSVRGKYRLVAEGRDQIIDVLPGQRWQVGYSSGKLQFTRDGRQVGSYAGPVVLEQVGSTVAVLGGSGALKNTALDANMKVAGADQVTDLKTGAGKVSVVSASGTSLVQGGGELNLVTLSISGRPQVYRGGMEFRAQGKGITVINELPLEEYLYGVLPREIYAAWPLEAQKAQAVSARSYAVAQLGTYREYGFDLLATQQSQMYGGYSAEHPNSTRAVDGTKGQVLVCRGKPISGFFHSSSGGYIENCQDVWTATLDYIKVRPDPYDKGSPYYNWLVTYSQEQLVNQLKEKKQLYNKGVNPERVFSRVDNIELLEKTASGARVKKMRVTGQDASGKPLTADFANADTVRSALGLRSSLFELTKVKGPDGKLSQVSIKGSGNGHGLGLSQYGALGMASQGYNYQDILKYYYSNIEIRPLS